MHVERTVIAIQPKQTRLIRAPFLGNAPSAPEEELAEEGEAAMSRFVEPYQLEDEHRELIRQLLDDLQISDEEGRRLFLLALEYELGTFHQVVMEHIEPAEPVLAPANEQLTEIAETARRLADLLQAADEVTQRDILEGMADADIFNRISDQRYLHSLECEIDRLASACDLEIEVSQVQPAPSNEASRKFIGMLANIYSECFETAATPAADEPFNQILENIVEQTGLQVRYDEPFLEETLSGE